jgi:hypothetical protein
MRTTAAGLLMLLLAGCSTPGDLMKSKSANSYESRQAPRAVANCMARNQIQTGGIPPGIVDAPGGSVEFTIADRSGYAITQFHAIISPTVAGSSIKAWTASPYLRGTIEAGLLKGC